MSEATLAVVGTYLSAPEADVARSVLESEGIECIVRSDDCGGQYPALRRVDLLVRPGDVPRASDVLSVLPDHARGNR
jgi:hypothetical protein